MTQITLFLFKVSLHKCVCGFLFLFLCFSMICVKKKRERETKGSKTLQSDSIAVKAGQVERSLLMVVSKITKFLI